jgi:hypothetical protein
MLLLLLLLMCTGSSSKINSSGLRSSSRAKALRDEPFFHAVSACSEVKAKAEKRNPYSRHYAFKGRGRKEHLRADVKLDRSELTPARGSL